MFKVKHTIVKEKSVHTEDCEHYIHLFKILFGIINIRVYIEQRDSEGTRFKHFVVVSVFGKEVLTWQYVDEYRRDFYLD